MNAAPYYSQFDSKGRCVRHPSVQLCRKTLGGGWKTITSICVTCAMESVMQSPQAAYAYDDGENDDGGAPHSSRGHRQRRRSSVTDTDSPAMIGSHDDSCDQSFNDRSVLSAPAAYHRQTAVAPKHPPHHQQHHRRGPSGWPMHQDHQGHQHKYREPIIVPRQPQCGWREEEGVSSSSLPSRRNHQVLLKKQSSRCISDLSQDERSCDLTADMYAADVMSYGSLSTSSLSSKSSSSSSRGRTSNDRRGPSSSPPPIQEAEAFVCGMEYEKGKYTGQIDVRSRLPHGLGTLRATVAGGGGNGGVVLLEGEWHYGELVAPPAQPQGKNSESSWHDLNDVDERYCLPETDDEHGEDDDDDSSISSYSAERTFSPRNVATSRAHSGSFTRSPPGAAYSAREGKSSPLPTPPPPPSSHSSSGGSIAINGTRATFDRLQEYERYVDRCDEEGDWYHPNINMPASPTADGDYDRVRRVRFLCDP